MLKALWCCYHPPPREQSEQDAATENEFGVASKLQVVSEQDVPLPRLQGVVQRDSDAGIGQVGNDWREVLLASGADADEAPIKWPQNAPIEWPENLDEIDRKMFDSEGNDMPSRNYPSEDSVSSAKSKGMPENLEGARAYGSQIVVVGKTYTTKSSDGTWSHPGMPFQATQSSASVSSNYSLPPAAKPRPANFKRAFSAMAAGHEDSILRDWREMNEETDVPEYVIKCRDENEVKTYEALQIHDDPLQQFVPTFYGDVDQSELEGEELKHSYIRLTNLLRPFKKGAHVMDCKVGVRSFVEDEVKKSSLRPDLFQRMLLLDPSAPTEAEKADQACTKHRWMSFNDAYTRLAENGFRIDGIVSSHAHNRSEIKGELKKLHTLSEMARCIIKYFLPTLEGDQDDAGHAQLQLRRSVAQSMVARLEELRHAMRRSPFLASRSLVGSSVLFIVDANGPLSSAYLIDFAKTTVVPNGIQINHRSPWVIGNHEDGLFIGVDNLHKTWQIVLQILSSTELDAAATNI